MSRSVFACILLSSLACFVLGECVPKPGPTDYCAKSFCDSRLINVGCNPPPVTGGPACEGKHPSVIELTQRDIDDILAGVNTFRSLVASGANGPTFPAARRMPRLQWNAELAAQAGHNARSCVAGNDVCHNTANFSNSGQMLMFKEVPDVDLSNIRPLLGALLVLADEEISVYFNGGASVDSYSAASGVQMVPNMLNDRSTMMGCALQHWVEDGVKDMYYMVCNFSESPIEGKPLYKAGTPQ